MKPCSHTKARHLATDTGDEVQAFPDGASEDEDASTVTASAMSKEERLELKRLHKQMHAQAKYSVPGVCCYSNDDEYNDNPDRNPLITLRTRSRQFDVQN